jgi:hypothetical protein
MGEGRLLLNSFTYSFTAIIISRFIIINFMALIKCKQTDCPHELNTKLACTEVTALFGIRMYLEAELDKHAADPEQQSDVNKHLDYIKVRLEAFKIKEEENEYRSFIITKKSRHSTPANNVRELYLTCFQGHSFYYTVDCSK